MARLRAERASAATAFSEAQVSVTRIVAESQTAVARAVAESQDAFARVRNLEAREAFLERQQVDAIRDGMAHLEEWEREDDPNWDKVPEAESSRSVEPSGGVAGDDPSSLLSLDSFLNHDWLNSAALDRTSEGFAGGTAPVSSGSPSGT